MRLLAILTALAVSAPVLADTQLFKGKFESQALGRKVGYEVHLPPSDLMPTGPLPVLYFLHGLGDNETVWRKQDLDTLAVGLMREGRIPPMAVALMDGKRGFYTNAYAGGPRQEDAFLDFVAFVESELIPNPGPRAIAGVSMGGFGAVKIAFKHPHLFSRAATLSGSFNRTRTFDRGFSLKKILLKRVFGPTEDSAMREANDIFLMLETGRVPSDLALFVACGTEDRYGFQHGSMDLAATATLAGLETVERIGAGRHSYDYWRKVLPEALEYLADAPVRARDSQLAGR